MIDALYITTLVVIALFVVALAATLLTVAYLLMRTRSSLRDVAGAIATVADRAGPIGPVLSDLAADLTAVRDALVGAGARAPTPAPAQTDRDADTDAGPGAITHVDTGAATDPVPDVSEHFPARGETP